MGAPAMSLTKSGITSAWTVNGSSRQQIKITRIILPFLNNRAANRHWQGTPAMPARLTSQPIGASSITNTVISAWPKANPSRTASADFNGAYSRFRQPTINLCLADSGIADAFRNLPGGIISVGFSYDLIYCRKRGFIQFHAGSIGQATACSKFQ